MSNKSFDEVISKFKSTGEKYLDKAKKIGEKSIDAIKTTSEKYASKAKQHFKVIKLKKDCSDIIQNGVIELKTYLKRYPKGIINEVTTELIEDLEKRKTSINTLSENELRADCEDLLNIVNSPKASISENETTKKLENKELNKIYKMAKNTYLSLNDCVNELLNEYTKNNSIVIDESEIDVETTEIVEETDSE